MILLTDTERAQINAAIAAVEAQTDGELVTVIARRSDDYLYIPILWAALMALLVPALLAAIGNQFPGHIAYLAQLCTFLGSAALFNWSPLKMRLIPAGVKRQRAARHARVQFIQQHLHKTRAHTGILIFVSVAEQYVEILADSGINAVVDTDTWQTLVDDFVRQVKQGRIGAGLLATVAACGTILADHFPASGDSINELPDHLVEI